MEEMIIMTIKCLTTPIGEASWAFLTRPMKEDGYGKIKYGITLTLNEKDGKSLIKQIEKSVENFVSTLDADEVEAVTPISKKALNRIKQDDGTYKFQFSTLAQRTSEKTGKTWERDPIKVIDTKENPVPENVWVSNGSKVIVAFEDKPYLSPAGVVGFSFGGLQQVMLVEKADGGSGNYNTPDEVEVSFGKVPDGYVVSEEEGVVETEDAEESPY